MHDEHRRDIGGKRKDKDKEAKRKNERKKLRADLRKPVCAL